MTKRVLLCDDEVHVLKAAEFKLKRAGFEVWCADNGEKAWDLIQQECPDILITDCQMPRMDGLRLAELVHTTPLTHGLPVIMLTAKGFELSHERLRLDFGVLAVVPKPFSPRLLLERVQRVLGEQPSEELCATG